MIRPTHITIIPQFDFREGQTQKAECGKSLAYAVAIDSQDGTIPTITCEACVEIAKRAAAERAYYVVFCRGNPQDMAAKGRQWRQGFSSTT